VFLEEHPQSSNQKRPRYDVAERQSENYRNDTYSPSLMLHLLGKVGLEEDHDKVGASDSGA